jgi:hypothetical protein
MPSQIRKQSPTSQDSGTRVSAERVRMELCIEKESDGGARTLSFIRQRVCRRVLSDVYPIGAPSGTCSGCRSAWEKVMVVE